jgi:hypothetical protein
MRNGDEGCAEYEMREAEAHEAEMEAAAGAEGEAMAEAEEQEMTDPVREEMMQLLHEFHYDGMSCEYADYCDDLLRVIRGHCSRITIASGPGMVIKALVCNDALAKTLESLPEEVKDD